MMFADVSEAARDIGVVAVLALVLAGVAWHALGLLRIVVQRKLDVPQPVESREHRNGNDARTGEVLRDIQARVRDLQDHHALIQRTVDQGEFACQWRGRDEVRDLIDAIRQLHEAVDRLSQLMPRKGPNG